MPKSILPKILGPLLLALILVTAQGCKPPKEAPETKQKLTKDTPPAPKIILPQGSTAQPTQKVMAKIKSCPKHKLRLSWRDAIGTISSRPITHSSPQVEFDFGLARRRHNTLLLTNAENKKLAQFDFTIALPFKLPTGAFIISPDPLALPSTIEPVTLDAPMGARPRSAVLLELGLDKIKISTQQESLHYNEALEKLLTKKLDDYIKTQTPTRTVAVSLGSNWLGVKKRATKDASGFGRHLKQKYITLNNLSRSWNTKIFTWSDAILLTNSIAAKLDMAQYVKNEFNALIKILVKLIRKKLPDVLIGMTESPRTAFTVERFSTSGAMLDFITKSNLAPMAQLQSELLGKDALLIKTQVPNTQDSTQRILGWRHNLADKTPPPKFSPAQWRLISASRRIGKFRHKLATDKLPKPKIALAYSSRIGSFSRILTQTSSLSDNMKRQDSYSRAWAGWSELLADANFLARPINIEKLARGELTLNNFRAIIIPHSLILSPAELTALRKYAADGGMVIFDAAPTCSPDATREEIKALNAFLGLKLQNPRYSELGGSNLNLVSESLKYCHASFNSYFASPPNLGIGPAQTGIKLMGATHDAEFGATKALIVNHTKGGHVIVLNLALSGYLDISHIKSRTKGIQELLSRLLSRVGISRAINATPVDSKNLSIGVSAFETDSTTLLLACSKTPLKKKALIHLSANCNKPMALYDMLRGEFLKMGKGAVVSLPKDAPAIMTMLPYRVDGIKIKELAQGQAHPQKRFSVQIITDKNSKPGTHFVDITVSGPRKTLSQTFKISVELVDGRGEFTVPFGENKKDLLWSIHARDAASGAQAFRRFLLKASPR